ncbi:MAG: fumarylacetoacetate hydrolase family protein [Spirochaetota bacterium]
MKIVRFELDGQVRHGVMDGDRVYGLHGELFDAFEVVKNECHPLESVCLLAPVAPSKVVAVGLNYRDHAEEVGKDIPAEPMLFIKPSTAIIGPGEPIRLLPEGERVDYEAELAAVVGRRAYRVPEERVAEHLLGFTCLNDVTARDMQRRDGQWTRAKSFDTFCPLGPCIETELNPDGVEVRARVNGETRQASNTRNFIFPLARLVSFISRVMTLLPGDVVSTGTPSGIGPLRVGDVVEVEVEGIGVLRNPVRGYEHRREETEA